MVKRRWLAALAIALISAVAAAIALAMPAASAGATGQAKADAVALTLTGKDGTVRTYTLAALEARTTADQGFYQGYAGFLNSAGIPSPVQPVEGVKLSSLLADVGYDSTTDVTVTAIDGYSKLLSPQVMQGQGIDTYSDVNPYPQVSLPAGLTWTPVVVYAYKEAGQSVSDASPWIPEASPPDGNGPLRLWFALDTSSSPGYLVDGEWIVKWVNRVSVSGAAVQEWTVKLKGPKKTYSMKRTNFESCFNCHKTTVSVGSHKYQGIPLYYLAGKVDDNKATNNYGDFNVKLAKKGYWIDLRNSKHKISVSSKLIAGRSRGIIVAWKVDGKELTGAKAPLWLIGAKLTAAQRIFGVTSITLRGVPK